MNEPVKPGRGGARPGSGRKAPDGVRVSITARVSQLTAERLKLAQGANGLGATLDAIVADYTARHGTK